jgi:hypothetical protein
MKAQTNNLVLGIFLGLIAPTIVYFIIYLTGFKNISFVDFFYLLNEKNVLTKILSLCGLANLLVFFIFIWTNRLRSARGVLVATFIFTIIVLLLRVML